MGAVISQYNKPIAFYTRKLNPAQTRYTTTERELLSIVETLKEFQNILLGQQIEVHTDHKNLTCKNFNTERVMRWRLILEEYNPDLKYIKGENQLKRHHPGSTWKTATSQIPAETRYKPGRNLMIILKQIRKRMQAIKKTTKDDGSGQPYTVDPGPSLSSNYMFQAQPRESTPHLPNNTNNSKEKKNKPHQRYYTTTSTTSIHY